MTDEYAAGFIDAEGSFCCTKTLAIDVPNTYKPVLDQLCSHFGVGAVNPKSSKNSLGRKKQWRWRVGARADLMLVLVRLEKLLIEKAGKARLMINELNRRMAPRPRIRCKRGHVLDGNDYYVKISGITRRRCAICRREFSREHRARVRNVAKASKC